MRISDWSSDVCSSDLETRHHGAARRLDRGDSSSEIAPKLGEISAALGPKAPEEGSGRPEIGASPRLAHRLRCLSHSCRCWSARSKEVPVQKQSYWSLFNRPDTLFGICEGVGQDLWINPNLLRVTLAVAMLWNPVAVLATYALHGVGVMVSGGIAPFPLAGSLAPGSLPVAVAQGAGEVGVTRRR